MERLLAGGLLLVALLVAGCSTVDKLTGQTDNTVLPGQREDAIPGKTQFPEPGSSQPTATTATTNDPVAVEQTEVQQNPGCDASDPECQASSEDIYSDPQ